MKPRFLLHALGGALLALAFAPPALAQSYPATPAMLQSMVDPVGTVWANSVAPLNSNAVSPGKSPNVTGNSVALTGNATPGDVAYVFGAINWNDGAAVSGNTVSVSGAATTVGIETIGGSHWRLNGDTTATNNTVTVSGGTLGGAYGGYAETDAGGSATATGNKVIVSGGTFTDSVVGGEASVNGGSGNATSDGNTVEISGSPVFQSDVFGGISADISGTTTATNNTVTISGTPDLANAWLYGGLAIGSGTHVATGNTLQMKTAGVNVAGLRDFQKLDFTLPATLTAGSTVLTVTNSAALGTNTSVTVSAASGLNLAAGNVITLVSGVAIGGVAATSLTGSFTSGSNSYAYTLSLTGGKLLMTINGVTPLGGGAGASAAAVPTLGEYALALLALLLAAMTFAALRRKG